MGKVLISVLFSCICCLCGIIQAHKDTYPGQQDYERNFNYTRLDIYHDDHRTLKRFMQDPPATTDVPPATTGVTPPPAGAGGPACLVDKCLTCTNVTTNKCLTCDSGWYKRTWDGTKGYDECWSLVKLWLGIIGGILASLLLCGICYAAWKSGVTARNEGRITNAKNGPMITEMKEEPVVIRRAP
jgi:hypothetical protein